MQKTRFIVAIRKGLYDRETEMYSLPTCFDSEQSAQKAVESLSVELTSLPETKVTVVSQPMITLRPEAYSRYDEGGEFPRLYEPKKDEYLGYVIHIDLPDTDEVKKKARRLIREYGLQIVDEGPTTEKTLIFIL